MTAKQADKLIASGAIVMVRHVPSGDMAMLIFTSRDKRHIETACGAKLERRDLELVTA